MERKDFTIFHEPFSVLYYVHEAKGSAKFEAEANEYASSYEEIKQQILAAAEKGPVFFKDMAYHPFKHIMNDDALIKRLTNTFIIRNPEDTINSHYAMNPDMTQEEVGYERQLQLFKKIEQIQGDAALIVDSDDLTEDPDKVIEAYCKEIGISHKAEALEWEPGQPEAWKSWESWHKDASESKGIKAITKSYEVTVDNDPKLRKMCEFHKSYYNELRAHRKRARGNEEEQSPSKKLRE